MSIIARAQAIADELTAGDVAAYIDPAEAENNRPCVLVAPPVLDWLQGTYAGPAYLWRLIVLSSHPAGTLDALVELDELLAQLAGLVNAEQADPIAYSLTPETGAVPAYALRLTT